MVNVAVRQQLIISRLTLDVVSFSLKIFIGFPNLKIQRNYLFEISKNEISL